MEFILGCCRSALWLLLLQIFVKKKKKEGKKKEKRVHVKHVSYAVFCRKKGVQRGKVRNNIRILSSSGKLCPLAEVVNQIIAKKFIKLKK